MAENTAPNDGGPAFPQIDSFTDPLRRGMSLRDWFAGQALAGLLAQHMPRDEKRGHEPVYRSAYINDDPGLGDEHNLAEDAYIIADAMLEARTGESSAEDRNVQAAIERQEVWASREAERRKRHPGNYGGASDDAPDDDTTTPPAH